MAFTVDDYHDLARLLWEHPEWREELRRLLLSDELLALPELVRQLSEAQQRSEERLSKLEVTLQHLIKTQQRLTERVDNLAEGQKRLTEGQQHLTDTVGGLKERMLEMTYSDRAFAYFGLLLRRVRVTELHTLEEQLEKALTPDEFRNLLLLDLLVSGRLRHVPESPDILLAVEISSVVDKMDVARAIRRASLLRQVGYVVVPAVAGDDVTQGGEESAREQNVVLLQDGQVAFWPEALASWANIQLVEDCDHGLRELQCNSVNIRHKDRITDNRTRGKTDRNPRPVWFIVESRYRLSA